MHTAIKTKQREDASKLTTRGQSNLVKAASNAPHTLHALDSIAVHKIYRASQKLKIGHVTGVTDVARHMS